MTHDGANVKYLHATGHTEPLLAHPNSTLENEQAWLLWIWHNAVGEIVRKVMPSC
jgi:hypothetical protein